MTNIHLDISDSDIQALVDDEIPASQKAVLIEKIKDSPQSLHRLEYLLTQKFALKEWWKKQALQ